MAAWKHRIIFNENLKAAAKLCRRCGNENEIMKKMWRKYRNRKAEEKAQRIEEKIYRRAWNMKKKRAKKIPKAYSEETVAKSKKHGEIQWRRKEAFGEKKKAKGAYLGIHEASTYRREMKGGGRMRSLNEIWKGEENINNECAMKSKKAENGSVEYIESGGISEKSWWNEARRSKWREKS